MWISGKTAHELPTFCVGAGNKHTEKVCLHTHLWCPVQESISAKVPLSNNLVYVMKLSANIKFDYA